eukprot:3973152-Pyramimonas_sp.AAC.1
MEVVFETVFGMPAAPKDAAVASAMPLLKTLSTGDPAREAVEVPALQLRAHILVRSEVAAAIGHKLRVENVGEFAAKGLPATAEEHLQRWMPSRYWE